jgi:hypothetical protein
MMSRDFRPVEDPVDRFSLAAPLFTRFLAIRGQGESVCGARSQSTDNRRRDDPDVEKP